MRRRWPVVVAIAAALVVSRAPAALACSCATLPTAKHFKAAEAVFVGTAMAVESSPDRVTAQFSVNEVYKGTVGARAEVKTATSSDVCGVPFVAGQRYAVFAETAELEAGLCGGTSDDTTILAKAGITKVLARHDPGARPEVKVASEGGGRGFPVAIALTLLVAAGAAWGVRRWSGRGAGDGLG